MPNRRQGSQRVMGWTPRIAENPDASVNNKIAIIERGVRANADQTLNLETFLRLDMTALEGKPAGRHNYGNMRNPDGSWKQFNSRDEYLAAQRAWLQRRWNEGARTIRDAVEGRVVAGGAPARPRRAPVVQQVTENGATALAPGIDMGDFNADDILNMTLSDFGSRRPLGPQKPDPSKHETAKDERHLRSLLGDGGLKLGTAPNLTTDLSTERAQEKAAVDETAFKGSVTFGDRLLASVDTFLGNQIVSALSEEHGAPDPEFASFYMKHWDTIEEMATDSREVSELREATSIASLQAIQERIAYRRGTDFVLDSNGTGTAFRLGAGVLDPAGALAGLGIGKAFQFAGIGSQALAAAGKTGQAALSMAGEGAVGGLAFTAAIDKAGQYQDAGDYLMNGASGLAIGAALSPLALRGNRSATELTRMLDTANTRAREQADDILAQATASAGPGATPERVRAEADRIEADTTRSQLRDSLADIPDDLRLLSDDPERLLTADPAVKARVEEQGNLASISDEAERAMVGEHLARAEAILAANPIDQAATKTVLAKVGMESTGVRLLASQSPVARAVGVTLLEGTTGAAGRRRTAAMAQATRERLYNRHMIEFDSLYHQFRKGEGAGLVSEIWDGKVRRQFNDRVFAEVEARADTPAGTSFDTHPAVRRAADLFERGMDAMRIEQQHVGAVGNARLGSTSRGYMPHRLEPSKVLRLTPQQEKRVRDALAGQFIDPQNGFDAEFSAKLATKYIERAKDRAHGGYDVPFNLRSPEAADIVRDSLEAMGVPKDQVESLMGKYSRGGAGHTKQRLRIDMSADIGDGMKLQDLFVTDVGNLYRGYARRVSGEVALAQFGIMGKKGLNVLRKAVSETGASADDMRAYDQIAAEFLNTPFGTANHNYMDNIRIATSLSRLGGMGFTQFAEYGNGLAAVGTARVFQAIGALPRLAKEVTHLKKGGEAANPILGSLDTLGGHIGLDDYNLTRLFDVKDNDIQMYGSERIGVFTRTIRAAGNLQAMASGHRMITAVQTRGMAEQVVHKAMAMIRKGGDDVALDDMGIHSGIRDKLRADLGNIAEFDSSGRLLKLDLGNSKLRGHDLMEFRDAVERGASQIIQRTYTGETGKWAHSGFLKLLLQFRTFSLISVEKQFGRNLRNYGALKSSMYLMGAMSFALPIHMARTQLKMAGMSRSEREKFADRNLTPLALGRATLNYASASGLLGDIMDIGGGFAADFGMVDPDAAPITGARGQGKGQLIGGVVAPGVGLVEDLWDGVHGDGKKLAKALPGANLPYVAPLITGMTSE